VSAIEDRHRGSPGQIARQVRQANRQASSPGQIARQVRRGGKRGRRPGRAGSTSLRRTGAGSHCCAGPVLPHASRIVTRAKAPDRQKRLEPSSRPGGLPPPTQLESPRTLV